MSQVSRYQGCGVFNPWAWLRREPRKQARATYALPGAKRGRGHCAGIRRALLGSARVLCTGDVGTCLHVTSTSIPPAAALAAGMLSQLTCAKLVSVAAGSRLLLGDVADMDAGTAEHGGAGVEEPGPALRTHRPPPVPLGCHRPPDPVASVSPAQSFGRVAGYFYY